MDLAILGLNPWFAVLAEDGKEEGPVVEGTVFDGVVQLGHLQLRW